MVDYFSSGLLSHAKNMFRQANFEALSVTL